MENTDIILPEGYMTTAAVSQVARLNTARKIAAMVLFK
jgi:hypothetical protein